MGVFAGKPYLVWLLLVVLVSSAGAAHKSKNSKKHSGSRGSGSRGSSEWEWGYGEMTYVNIDLTIVESSAGRDVVEAALDTIDLSCIFPDDKLLVRRIAAALTNDGLAEDTFIGGAEGGIWNISEAILQTTRSSSVVAGYRDKILAELGIDWNEVSLSDMLKPLYSALATQLYIHSLTLAIPRSLEEQARFVADNILTDTPEVETTFNETFADLTDETCSSAAMDVVLVLDGSGSVGADNFDKVRSFVRRFIDAIDLSRSYTRVAVVQYSKKVQIEFYMNAYFDKADAKDAVTSIRYLTGTTNTAAALQVAAGHMFSTARGAREQRNGIPRVVIVLTDGQSNSPAATAEAARYLRETGVAVFAVGIGSGAVESELDAIASYPSCTHVYKLTGFEEIEGFVEEIKRSACREPAQLEVERAITTTLEAGQSLYATFMADVNKGFKFDFSTYKGEVRAFISTKTKNPNSASHMWRCRGNMNKRGRCFIPPGQLKKLARGAVQLPLYVTFMADDLEGAYFYLQTAGSYRLCAHISIFLTALITLLALL